MAKEKAVEFGIIDDFTPPDKRCGSLPNRLTDGQTVIDVNLIHTETVTIEGSEEISFRCSFYYTLLGLLLNELQKRSPPLMPAK